MKETLLSASVKTMAAKDRMVNKVRDTFAGNENGDIVQTVIIIAMFVLICVVVGGLLYAAISGQAKTTSECIATVNTGKCANFK